jgi:hypothetical protein
MTMKKFLMLSAAALALAVAPASADTYGPFDTGTGPSGNLNGGAVTWSINGNAADYCVLGTITAGNTAYDHNVSIVTGGTGNNQTGTVNITQFQGPNDNANAWHAQVTLPNTVCNVVSVISAKSTNGGLAYTGTSTTTDPNFTTKEDYTVNVNYGSDGFNSNGGQVSGMTTTHNLWNAKQPSAGNFVIDLYGAADATKYLLSGNYTDSLVITMAPKT